jgi:SOS response regulatory protein OraA/RecX
MGVRRLVSELYFKGIGRDDSVPVIERVFREQRTSEEALARRAAEKRLRALPADAGPETLRRKLHGHLDRRGFGGRAVWDVVDELVEDREA